MPLQWAIVFFAWGGAAVLAAIPNLRHATIANIAVSAGSFLMALALAAALVTHEIIVRLVITGTVTLVAFTVLMPMLFVFTRPPRDEFDVSIATLRAEKQRQKRRR